MINQLILLRCFVFLLVSSQKTRMSFCNISESSTASNAMQNNAVNSLALCGGSVGDLHGVLVLPSVIQNLTDYSVVDLVVL